MSFTILFAVLAVLLLIMIFGFAYKIKGLKTALISTGIALAVFIVLFIVTIYAIVNAM